MSGLPTPEDLELIARFCHGITFHHDEDRARVRRLLEAYKALAHRSEQAANSRHSVVPHAPECQCGRSSCQAFAEPEAPPADDVRAEKLENAVRDTWEALERALRERDAANARAAELERLARVPLTWLIEAARRHSEANTDRLLTCAVCCEPACDRAFRTQGNGITATSGVHSACADALAELLGTERR